MVRMNAYRSGPRPDLWQLFGLYVANYSFLLPDVPRVTTYAPPNYLSPDHSTINYHILSLVDIGRSIHTA